MITEIVTDFSEPSDGSDSAVDLQGKKERGAGGYESTFNGSGRIVKKKLGVSRDAEIDQRFP